MAEVVGLISAIGSICAASIKVAKLIFELADDLGAAGTQVRMLASDTNTLSWVLNTLERQLRQAKAIPHTGLEVTRNITKSVQLEIEEIDEMLKPLLSSSGRKMTTNQKVKWIFTKSRIMTRQAALDSLKASLTLVLHALDFIERQDPDDKIKLRGGFEALHLRSPKVEFINAEQQDQALKEKAERLSVRQTQRKRISARSSADICRSVRPHTYEDSESETWVDETENAMALATLSSFATKLDLGTQKPSTDLVLRMPDEQFMAIARHLDIHKQVIQFVNTVIGLQPKDGQPGLPDQNQSFRTENRYFKHQGSEYEYDQDSLANDSTSSSTEIYTFPTARNTATSHWSDHPRAHAAKQSTNSLRNWSGPSYDSYRRSSEPLNTKPRPHLPFHAPIRPSAPKSDEDSALVDDYGSPDLPDKLQTARARGVRSWLRSVKAAAPEVVPGLGNTPPEGWDNYGSQERPLWHERVEKPVSESTLPTAAEHRGRNNTMFSLGLDKQHLNREPGYRKPHRLGDDPGASSKPRPPTAKRWWEQKGRVEQEERRKEKSKLQTSLPEEHLYPYAPRHFGRSPSPSTGEYYRPEAKPTGLRKQPSPQEGGAYLYSSESSREEARKKLSAKSLSDESEGESHERTIPQGLKLTHENVLDHVRLLGLPPGPWELAEEEASMRGSANAHISEQDEVKLLRRCSNFYL